MYKKLFKINFNNKKILLFSSEENRIAFLEVTSDNKLRYITLQEFFVLNKIYNYKDSSILYDIKKLFFDEKYISKNGLISVLLAINLFNLTMLAAPSIDKYRNDVNSSSYEETTKTMYSQGFTTDYEIKKYLLNQRFNNENISREDVIEAVNSNANLSNHDKEMAIMQLDSMLKLDPEMDLRIYYENLKTIKVEWVSHKNWDLSNSAVGYYLPRENIIRILKGTDNHVLCHELAHAAHTYYRNEDDEIIEVFEENFLTEALTDEATLYSYYEASYEIENKVLKFFIENAKEFNTSVYNQKGIQALLLELKDLYPSVDIDYIFDMFENNRITRLNLGQNIVLEDEEELLDELFKITILNIDENNLFSSFNSFVKIIGNNDNLYSKYMNKYLDVLKNNGYLNDTELYSISSISNFIIVEDNIYLCCDNEYFYDYEGNKQKIENEDYVFPISPKIKSILIESILKNENIYSEEYISKFCSSGEILEGFNSNEFTNVSKEDLIRILDVVFNIKVDNEKDYHSMQQSYLDFKNFLTNFGHERKDNEFFTNKREIVSENRYFNMYKDACVGKGYITLDRFDLANEITSFVKIDGKFYPVTKFLTSPDCTIMGEDSNQVIRIINSERLICEIINEEGNKDTIELYNGVFIFYKINDEAKMKLESLFANDDAFELDSIINVINEESIITQRKYENIFKLSNGESICDRSLDDSFYIEFGKEGNNITYRISRNNNNIYSSCENFVSLSSKIKFIDFLNSIVFYNDDGLDKILTQDVLIKTLNEFSNIMPEVEFVRKNGEIEYMDPSTNERVRKIANEDSIEFVNPPMVVIEGNEYYARNVMVSQDYSTKTIYMYLPDGRKYEVFKYENEDIAEAMNIYLDELINYYHIESENNIYYYSPQELIQLFKNMECELFFDTDEYIR